MSRRIIVVDSVTEIVHEAAGHVVVSGSHGGTFAAEMAITAGVAGVIFNDAGVGLHEAGIEGLVLLAQHGIAAATVDHRSACIGNAAETHSRGLVSHTNRIARQLGVEARLTARQAASIIAEAELVSPRPLDRRSPESRHLISRQPVAVWALDSASLIHADDAGSVVITGSHGGLLGDRPASALKVAAWIAAFNDAGGGRHGAGFSRLPALDQRRIAAVTVDAATAEIGRGLSSYRTGVISCTNDTAQALGAAVGMNLRHFIASALRSAEGSC